MRFRLKLRTGRRWRKYLFRSLLDKLKFLFCSEFSTLDSNIFSHPPAMSHGMTGAMGAGGMGGHQGGYQEQARKYDKIMLSHRKDYILY